MQYVEQELSDCKTWKMISWEQSRRLNHKTNLPDKQTNWLEYITMFDTDSHTISNFFYEKPIQN